jgi:23S rRNA pseudouridine1911/1915/1917 synthase
LAYRYRERTYVFRPVNRLDRDTSGVMLTANTKLAAHRMAKSMQSGRIQKSYIAIAEGVPPMTEGVIDGFMHRTADSIITRETCDADAPGARRAVTEYRVLYANDRYSVILARPITGRTHQIRVQLTSIGCPLVGDTLYGRADAQLPRHALHAFQTEFPHPADDRPMCVRAPLPEDMKNWIAEHFATDAMTALQEMDIL